jgi:CheY-like chemotaxis protein
MTQSITHPDRFEFQDQELPQKLVESIQPGVSGYWQIEFDRLANREPPFYWHLAVINGQIVYSGGRIWTAKTLVSTLQRYTPQLRQEPAKSQLDSIKQDTQDLNVPPIEVWQQMKTMGISDEDRLIQALRLKILSDLDTYLLLGSGRSKFIVEQDLVVQFPVKGFSLAGILDGSKQRRSEWTELEGVVTTMDLIPILDRAALERSNLSAIQRQRIEDLVKSKKSIAQVACGMSKDNLEVAQMFAKLANAGLVTLRSPQSLIPPTIMIIDDSPVVLSQFQHWLTVLGYPVVVCQDAEIAISKILQVKPATILIDINMPGLSGFELVKQIRQQPEIANTPLAILTGEQKLSNKWRAQWSGCEFLTKPVSMSEISSFQTEFQQVIQKLLTEGNSPVPAITEVSA